MRILFMGTPDFAVPSLEALVAAGHEVVGVFSQPDKPKNRGMKLQPTPVKCCAQAHGLAVFQPTKLRDGTALETIVQLAPDLIVVAAYGRILPQEILSYPRLGCINVHSSLLPKYRGAAPIHWAILNGEQETGVTIMHMALALDAGDIIAQRATPIDPDETVETLHDRLARLGAELLVEEGWTVSRTERYVEEVLRDQAKEKKVRRPLFIRDVRFFLNTLDHSLTVMRSAGVDAKCQRVEEGDDILLTIRIPKAKAPSGPA